MNENVLTLLCNGEQLFPIKYFFLMQIQMGDAEVGQTAQYRVVQFEW